METIAGRYHVVEHVWGDAAKGLVRARDDAGRRYLVTIEPHYPPRLAALLDAEPSLAVPGVAPLVDAFTHEGNDLVVEAEPAGVPSAIAPPASPEVARSRALALVAIVRAIGVGVRGVERDLVYVEGARITGLAPRAQRVAFERYPTQAGGFWPRSPLDMTSHEQAMAQPPTAVHDAYMLAAMLRWWLTASPLIAPDGNSIRELVHVLQRAHFFHYDGPLHDVIDAGLAGAPLDELTGRLAHADLAAAEAEHATRARLLAEIVAAPDDDGPRFVLADHLLERGDPRGELLAADALLATHGTRWSAHLAAHAREVVFERGFIGLVRGGNRIAIARRLDQLRAFGPLPRVE